MYGFSRRKTDRRCFWMSSVLSTLPHQEMGKNLESKSMVTMKTSVSCAIASGLQGSWSFKKVSKSLFAMHKRIGDDRPVSNNHYNKSLKNLRSKSSVQGVGYFFIFSEIYFYPIVKSFEIRANRTANYFV